MPKKITASYDTQDELIEGIKKLVFGDKNWCLLYDLDKNTEMHQKINEMIPDLRTNFLIHNIAGVQRPDTLKRPWLSIMRTFLRKKYHVVSENYLLKRPEGVVATKRYILLAKDAIDDAGTQSSAQEMQVDTAPMPASA